MNDEQRFMSKVAASPDGCWLWTGSRRAIGYGTFYLPPGAGKRYVIAHRWAYEHWVRPIPDGMEIDHLCRTPACVNPEHLDPVTHQENVRRSVEARNGRCRSGNHDMRVVGQYRDGKCKACVADRRRIPGAIQHGEKEVCPEGHPYSGENLRLVKTGTGGVGRRCRECDRRRSAEAYRKRSGSTKKWKPRRQPS